MAVVGMSQQAGKSMIAEKRIFLRSGEQVLSDTGAFYDLHVLDLVVRERLLHATRSCYWMFSTRSKLRRWRSEAGEGECGGPLQTRSA